jgi:hypothetical protein
VMLFRVSRQKANTFNGKEWVVPRSDVAAVSGQTARTMVVRTGELNTAMGSFPSLVFSLRDYNKCQGNKDRRLEPKCISRLGSELSKTPHILYLQGTCR